jgi:hypothetical protein
MSKLELQREKDALALIERKLRLGLATNDELLKQLQKYENYVLENYEKNSDAYLTMLERRQSIHKRFADEQKREIDDISKQWSKSLRAFNNNTIDLSELKSEFADVNQILSDLRAEAEDPTEIDVIINRMTNEINNVETKHETQKSEVKFEFENAQTNLQDPQQAQLNAQLKALEDFYAKRREMLLEAGISETAIDEQIARERHQIEKAFQIARFETISNGMGKVLGDLAKSGVVSFKTAQALQIAQLLIETPAAAFAAYRSVVGIPFVGPALAPIAFATAIATGMTQIANIKKQKPPKAEKGGLLTGKSHSKGGIRIEAEGNEYITNKRRVAELGKGFFDFVNFAPLEKVKSAFANISIPTLNVPQMPKYAFESGGYVQSHISNINAVESKLDTLIDKVIDGFEMIDRKDLSVNIKSSLNSIKYIRDHNRALEEYNRKTK